MFLFYDLIFLLIVLVTFPVYLFKGKLHRHLYKRFGLLPKDLSLSKPVWIHAVSVGEVMAVRPLIEELRKIYPSKQFVISTVTPTGNKIAQGLVKPGDLAFYLPFDFSFIVRGVVTRIKPAIFVLAETEIWPNLILRLNKEKIPIVTVNGRISDSSYKGYTAVKLLLKPILSKISLFCVQSVRDKERLAYLGVAPEKIEVSGNMKFDSSQAFAGVSGYRERLNLGVSDKLLVAGSTHDGEEGIILDAYKDLLQEFPGLKLLIAPRHPHRSADVGKLACVYGFNPVFTSAAPYSCSACVAKPLYILDSVGELVSYYAASDIVFVGGSLVKKGGHNILEPASLGKPVICGPFMFNFRDIAEDFLNNGALLTVHNRAELTTAARQLLQDPQKTAHITEKAQLLIRENRGASIRNAQYLRKFIVT